MGGGWALPGCTVSPGFEFEDYEARQEGGLARDGLSLLKRLQLWHLS